MSDERCSKIMVGKKIDENTFELIEVFDLNHPECPIVVIDGKQEILDEEPE